METFAAFNKKNGEKKLIEAIEKEKVIEPEITVKETMPLYRVVVGNVGQVFSGEDETLARKTYDIYVLKSSAGYGSLGHEMVLLTLDGEDEPLAKYQWQLNDFK